MVGVAHTRLLEIKTRSVFLNSSLRTENTVI